MAAILYEIKVEDCSTSTCIKKGSLLNLPEFLDFRSKEKVVPYTFVRMGVPVREDT